jgi:hypothetical protein
MRRKGGGGGGTQPSSSHSTGTYSSRDTMQSNISCNEPFRTIIITSFIWTLILAITLSATIQYYSSAKCSENSLVKKAFCGIGQVLTRFCSDSQQFEPIYNSPPKSHTKNSVEKSSKGNIPRVRFTDAYADETCQKNGICSRDQQTFHIPDLSTIPTENPLEWPGEMGEPFLPPDYLLEESKRRFPENMFDIAVSDRIALNRAMPDIRNDHCKAHPRFNGPLPNTSVIIVFHNEGNSTLLRTLVSIINRTPWILIHEIILLDDASVDREYLHGPLQDFIETLPVRTILLRNEKRLGLISSRVRAAKIATGETLMFLDSHVEVLNGWLLYLLEEIKKDRKTIVCPIIDVLTWDAFQLLHGATDIFGTFSWKMIFRWSKIQDFHTMNEAKPIP